MAKNPWLSRLLAGTRGRILEQLRSAPATIAELTERLALSANAVRSHLAALERDGLVAVDALQRHAVGKPAHQYRLTADAGALTPKAYDAMLDLVLGAARDRAGARGYAEILKTVAARLAGSAPAGSGSLDERLADTQALLAQIGAAVDVQRSRRKLRLVGSDCPLAAVVAAHPELCGVLAGAIARRLDLPVSECCDRSGPLPRCCFEAVIAGAA